MMMIRMEADVKGPCGCQALGRPLCQGYQYSQRGVCIQRKLTHSRCANAVQAVQLLC
jgi:hypothetical protein